jgi:hypothetical protein
MKIFHWKTAHFDGLVRPKLSTGAIRRMDAIVEESPRIEDDVIVSDHLTE